MENGKVSGIQLFRQILYDTIPMPATLWDENGNIIDCNNAMVKFLRCESKENCLQRFFAYSTPAQPCGLPSQDKAANLIKQTAELGHANFEWTHIIDDEVVDVELACICMKQYGEQYTAMYTKDMRELKRRQTAEEESRAKTKFLARMSHEIRTPMNAVLGITEMQMHREGLPADTEEAFSRIYSSSNLLLSIINDILDLSKVEAGKMEILDAHYDVASMLVDTVQLNLMHIGSKPIQFKLTISEDIPSCFLGDEIRIKQVMNNILSNAFKYTEEGTVSLDVSVTDAYDDKRMLTFVVKDTGQGMTREQLDNLFEIEFTRFNSANNKSIEGSGLGMNIAYQLIGLMGGNIKVKSDSGVGTTFMVSIPQMPHGDTTLGKETVTNLQNIETAQRALKRQSRLAEVHMPYGRVLVVDDVESNLYVAKGLLMPYKLTVETVDSGRAALHRIRGGQVYDIIFMDHMMPGMDGIEATKKIRDMGYDAPIIALTANTVMGQSELFIKNGFSGFISKPIDVNRLNTYLLRMIRDKQPPEVLAAAARDQEMEQKGTFAEVFPQTPGEMSARLRESFVRDARRSAEALTSAMSQRHLDTSAFKIYIIHTHALKAALQNINEPILAAIASALEQAGREGDDATINALTPGFLTRLDDVVKEISDNLAKQAQQALARTAQNGGRPVAQTNNRGSNGHTSNNGANSSNANGNAIANAQSTTSDNANAQSAVGALPSAGVKIFVVDDSDTNLILAEEALEDFYELYTMDSADKMFKLLAKVKPQLILLDIEMPNMDGYEALAKIKDDPTLAAIPVVFLTATVTPEITSRTKQLGAADIVQKPFVAEKLRKKINVWLTKPGSKPTILIVDDTPMIISTLSRMLLPLYNVKVAKDGIEGLRLANTHTLDLILLDLNMPGISGFDVLTELKENEKTRNLPVIFITGSDETDDETQGFSLGAVDYIKKPFVEESVLHRVELHIHGGKG